MASEGLQPDMMSIARSMTNLVNSQDVEAIVKAQQATSRRLEKSNEMLRNCNNLSSHQLELTSKKFREHTEMLQRMRVDLQSIFSRVRNLRSKLQAQYPGEFALALEKEMQNVSFREQETSKEDYQEQELYDLSKKSHFSQNKD